ncbi:hypothetical protein ACTFIZ_000188 [Dictyostelium cf. discoideum]
MFEHVSLKNLRQYFKVNSLLADNGAAMNHGITPTDVESGESPLGAGGFIDRYSPSNIENLRRHYALTLEHWADNFEVNGEKLRGLAGEQRYRIWRVYLAGCAYGFAHNWIALHQILATKTSNKSWPLTRDYMYR